MAREIILALGLLSLAQPATSQMRLEASYSDIRTFVSWAEDCRNKSQAFASLLTRVEALYNIPRLGPSRPDHAAVTLRLSNETSGMPANPGPWYLPLPRTDDKVIGPTQRYTTAATVQVYGYDLDMTDLSKAPSIQLQGGNYSFPAGVDRWAISRCEMLGHELAELYDAYRNGWRYSANHTAALSVEASIRTGFGSPGVRGAETRQRHGGHEDVVIPVGARFVIWHTYDNNSEDIQSITYR